MYLLHPQPVSTHYVTPPAPRAMLDAPIHYDLRQPEQLKVPLIDQATLNSDTILVVPYQKNQSLILDRLNGLHRTPYSTRQLMQNYNRHQILDFSQTRHLWHCFNHHRKVPQINGEYQFLPLGGPVHRNVAWLALHYVQAYELERHTLSLLFLNQNSCQITYRGRHLASEIHDCATIGRIAQSSLAICAFNFGYHVKLQTCFQASIIHQYDTCNCCSCQKIPCTTTALLRLLTDLENYRSDFIYQAARQEYDEYDVGDFWWYRDGVAHILRRLRRL